MKLLQNEEKLISSNADKIVLTNQRIMLTDKVWGKSFKISICLENISSIESHYKSNILFLILGIFFTLGGLVMSTQGGGGGAAMGGLVLGGVFIAIWWFTRKHIVTISSNGGSHLNFIVENMSNDKIDDFVTTVQEAKIKRVNQLFTR